MKNPLTLRVESSLGAVFVSLLSMFFIGLLFIAIKNSDAEVDVLVGTPNNSQVSWLSQSERILIGEWIAKNNIEIPEGSGYKYLLRKYPDRPWLNE